MPTIAEFLGILILMHSEKGAKHKLPHFHVKYAEHEAVFSICPVALIAGKLPKKQDNIVRVWAEIKQTELMRCWDNAVFGKSPGKIK